MFYIDEILISSQTVQKRIYDFFYRNVTAFHEAPLTPCFPSRNITKNAETHPPPMRDAIIEQPLGGNFPGWGPRTSLYMPFPNYLRGWLY